MDALRDYTDSDSSGDDSNPGSPQASYSQRQISSSRTMERSRNRSRSRSRSPKRRDRVESGRSRDRRSNSPRYSSSSERHSRSDHRRHHHSSRHRDRDGSYPHSDMSRKSERSEDRTNQSSKQQGKDTTTTETIATPVGGGVGGGASATTWSTDSTLTPEQKLEQALAARQAQAAKLPQFMNPGAANPAKLQASQEKRKLLWNKTKKERSWNNWESASFDDGGQSEKFRRLMGIKGAASGNSGGEAGGGSADSEQKRKHAKLMQDLEFQYETSRFMTHKARGVGLGFGLTAQTLDPKVEQSTDDLLESSDKQ